MYSDLKMTPLRGSFILQEKVSLLDFYKILLKMTEKAKEGQREAAVTGSFPKCSQQPEQARPQPGTLSRTGVAGAQGLQPSSTAFSTCVGRKLDRNYSGQHCTWHPSTRCLHGKRQLAHWTSNCIQQGSQSAKKGGNLQTIQQK